MGSDYKIKQRENWGEEKRMGQENCLQAEKVTGRFANVPLANILK